MHKLKNVLKRTVVDLTSLCWSALQLTQNRLFHSLRHTHTNHGCWDLVQVLLMSVILLYQSSSLLHCRHDNTEMCRRPSVAVDALRRSLPALTGGGSSVSHLDSRPSSPGHSQGCCCLGRCEKGAEPGSTRNRRTGTLEPWWRSERRRRWRFNGEIDGTNTDKDRKLKRKLSEFKEIRIRKKIGQKQGPVIRLGPCAPPELGPASGGELRAEPFRKHVEEPREAATGALDNKEQPAWGDPPHTHLTARTKVPSPSPQNRSQTAREKRGAYRRYET